MRLTCLETGTDYWKQRRLFYLETARGCPVLWHEKTALLWDRKRLFCLRPEETQLCIETGSDFPSLRQENTFLPLGRKQLLYVEIGRDCPTLLQEETVLPWVWKRLSYLESGRTVQRKTGRGWPTSYLWTRWGWPTTSSRQEEADLPLPIDKRRLTYRLPLDKRKLT
jgi:hypothetical protein